MNEKFCMECGKEILDNNYHEWISPLTDKIVIQCNECYDDIYGDFDPIDLLD